MRHFIALQILVCLFLSGLPAVGGQGAIGPTMGHEPVIVKNEIASNLHLDPHIADAQESGIDAVARLDRELARE